MSRASSWYLLGTIALILGVVSNSALAAPRSLGHVQFDDGPVALPDGETKPADENVPAGKTLMVTREGELFELEDNAPVLDDKTDIDPGFEGLAPQGAAPTSQRNVIGSDDRTQITNTTAFPYRTHGYLANGCTGTLIGPKHVLTAAHCVFNIKTKKWVQNLDFTPGRSGSTKPYGTAKWASVKAVTGWTEKGQAAWDIAVVILQDKIGDQTGWMAYGHKSSMTSAKININGYPSDKPQGTMWHSFCSTAKMDEEHFHYPCDTYPGNSGSAVYVYNKEKDERVIYAVHTNGGTTNNFGCRINKAKFDKVKGWKDANP